MIVCVYARYPDGPEGEPTLWCEQSGDALKLCTLIGEWAVSSREEADHEAADIRKRWKNQEGEKTYERLRQKKRVYPKRK